MLDFSGTFVDDEDVLGIQFIAVLANDKSPHSLEVLHRNLERLSDIENQVLLPLRNMPISKYKFDDLDDHDRLLLHGQGLVDLLGYLHDLSPVIHKLQRFIIDIRQLGTCCLTVCFNKFIEKVQVVPRAFLVEVQG